MKRLLCLVLCACMVCSLALAEDDWGFEEVLLTDSGEEIILGGEGEEAILISTDGMDVLTDPSLDEQWEIDDTVDPDSLDINPNLPSNVVNILLIGIDSRAKDIHASSELQHGDVQIILSINTDDGSIKLTSVLRDLYVDIPGTKNKARINTAYAKGGGALAMRTINNLLELNIQYYATINFYGLASIIESLGGIDIELTKAEAKAINAYIKRNPPAYDTLEDSSLRVPLEPVAGVQHCDGIQAVMYARLRSIDNDFARTARQRKLLELLLHKVMQDMDLSTLMNLVSSTLPYVTTNASMSTIVNLAVKTMNGGLLQRVQSGEPLLEQHRIPMDHAYGYKDVNGSSVIVWGTKNYDKNLRSVHEFIYGEYIPSGK